MAEGIHVIQRERERRIYRSIPSLFASLRRNWIIPSDDDINSSDSPSARVKRGKRGGTMIGFSVNFIWTDGISSLSAPLLPGERIYFCRVDTRDTACCSTRFPRRSPPVIADLLCRIACVPRCSLSLSLGVFGILLIWVRWSFPSDGLLFIYFPSREWGERRDR